MLETVKVDSKHWSRRLVKMRACKEAVAWAKTQPSYEVAWDACPRGEWLLWLAGRLPSVTRQALVLAECACARLAHASATSIAKLQSDCANAVRAIIPRPELQ